jgi:malate synthase
LERRFAIIMSDSPRRELRGVAVRGPMKPEFASVLTAETLAFVAALHRRFEERRQGLLQLRSRRQAQLDAGELPAFPEHTRHIREGSWKGPHIPRDLADRRVEITGPVDRKMVVNALNSGAKVFMADFEDSTSPTWSNLLEGQINLRDAVNRTISLTDERTGKRYALRPEGELATLMVRPRGWHLDEEHLHVDGQPVSGSLFDFAVFFFHNAHALLARGSGPYFYLPKMEAAAEARLWNDVFVFAQDYCDVPRGSVRATVLLETILASFEIDEILFELREHSAGMNCGRWDYIFSFIKKFRSHASLVLPDRAEVGFTKPFMAHYVNLVINTCHKRGVHAIGGMAAQIPVKDDPAANAAAISKVKADKLREVKAGHDGTWVAHPALVAVATEVFNEHMKGPHQIHVLRPEANAVTPRDLILPGEGGNRTEAGLRNNIAVGLQYLEAWLRGVGCVPINNLMEDAATAEISRSQIWQWLRHGATIQMANGSTLRLTRDMVQRMLSEEVDKIRQALGQQAFDRRPWRLAEEIYGDLMLSEQLKDFMTTAAYKHILTLASGPAKL